MRLGHMALGCRSQKKAGPGESKALNRRGLAAASDLVAYNGLSMRVGHGIVCGVAHGMRHIRRHAGTPCPETCRPHLLRRFPSSIWTFRANVLEKSLCSVSHRLDPLLALFSPGCKNRPAYWTGSQAHFPGLRRWSNRSEKADDKYW